MRKYAKLCPVSAQIADNLADNVAAMLSRDARQLDPELELDTLLRPFAGDKMRLLHAAIIAF